MNLNSLGGFGAFDIWSYPWLDVSKDMVKNKEALSVNLLLFLWGIIQFSHFIYQESPDADKRLRHWIVYDMKHYHLIKFCILSGLSLPFALISEADHWVNTQGNILSVQWAIEELLVGPSLLIQIMILDMTSPHASPAVSISLSHCWEGWRMHRRDWS